MVLLRGRIYQLLDSSTWDATRDSGSFSVWPGLRVDFDGNVSLTGGAEKSFEGIGGTLAALVEDVRIDPSGYLGRIAVHGVGGTSSSPSGTPWSITLLRNRRYTFVDSSTWSARADTNFFSSRPEFKLDENGRLEVPSGRDAANNRDFETCLSLKVVPDPSRADKQLLQAQVGTFRVDPAGYAGHIAFHGIVGRYGPNPWSVTLLRNRRYSIIDSGTWSAKNDSTYFAQRPELRVDEHGVAEIPSGLDAENREYETWRSLRTVEDEQNPGHAKFLAQVETVRVDPNQYTGYIGFHAVVGGGRNGPTPWSVTLLRYRRYSLIDAGSWSGKIDSSYFGVRPEVRVDENGLVDIPLGMDSLGRPVDTSLSVRAVPDETNPTKRKLLAQVATFTLDPAGYRGHFGIHSVSARYGPTPWPIVLLRNRRYVAVDVTTWSAAANNSYFSSKHEIGVDADGVLTSIAGTESAGSLDVDRARRRIIAKTGSVSIDGTNHSSTVCIGGSGCNSARTVLERTLIAGRRYTTNPAASTRLLYDSSGACSPNPLVVTGGISLPVTCQPPAQGVTYPARINAQALGSGDFTVAGTGANYSQAQIQTLELRANSGGTAYTFTSLASMFSFNFQLTAASGGGALLSVGPLNACVQVIDNTLVVFCNPNSPPPPDSCLSLEPRCQVSPVLTCVVPGSGAGFTAVFGYHNRGSTNLRPADGQANTLTGATSSVIPPQLLQAGHHPVAFSVRAAGETVSWTVGSRVATASVSSPVCQQGACPAGQISVAGACHPMPTEHGAPLAPGEVLPTTPGTLPGLAGALSVSPTGSSSYSLPLWVPAGRRRVQPNLALVYDSANRSGAGPLGVGWSLSGLSSIERCGRTVAQDGRAASVRFSDDDALCLDGRRLVSTIERPGAAEYRTERDDGSRIVGHGVSGAGLPTSFTVFHSDGRRSFYGDTVASRKVVTRRSLSLARSVDLEAGGDFGIAHTDEGVTAAWLLRKVEDTLGNNLVILYEDFGAPTDLGRTSSEVLPKEIRYTGFGNRAGRRAVTFHYEARSADSRRDLYQGGVLFSHSRLLRRVTMSAPDPEQEAVVRGYRIDYEVSPMTGRDRLKRVTECDGDPSASHAVCRPATEFDWENGSWSYDVISQDDPEVIDQSDPTIITVKTADLDGDGMQDIIYRNGSEWRYRLAGELLERSAGGQSTLILGAGHTFNINGELTSATGVYTKGGDPLFVDLNRDGMPEIGARIVRPTDDWYKPDEFKWWQRNPTSAELEYLTLQGTPRAYIRGLLSVTDLTGSGLPKVLQTGLRDGTTEVAGISVWGYFGGSNAPSLVGTPRQLTRLLSGTAGGLSTDFDGDGADEILIAPYEPLVDPAEPAVLAAEGDGDVEVPVTPPTPELPDGPPPCDAQGVRFLEGSTTWSAVGARHVPWSGTGSGFETTGEWRTTLFGPRMVETDTCGTIYKESHRQRTWFADLNGDGLSDAVLLRYGADPNRMNRLWVQMNTGAGFDRPVALLGGLEPAMRASSSNAESGDIGVRLMDYDQDGRQDVLLVDDGGRMAITTGSMAVAFTCPSRDHLLWYRGETGGVATEQVFPREGVPIRPTQGGYDAVAVNNSPIRTPQTRRWCLRSFRQSQLFDFNGDGMTDLVQVENGKLVVYQRAGTPPDMLRRVTEGFGRNEEVTYRPVSDPSVHVPATTNCSYPLSCTKAGRWVVAERTVDNGTAVPTKETFRYYSGRSDLRGRSFLGFAARESTVTVGTQTRFKTSTEYGQLDEKIEWDSDRVIYPLTNTVTSEMTEAEVEPIYVVDPPASVLRTTYSKRRYALTPVDPNGVYRVSLAARFNYTVEHDSNNPDGYTDPSNVIENRWTQFQYDDLGNEVQRHVSDPLDIVLGLAVARSEVVWTAYEPAPPDPVDAPDRPWLPARVRSVETCAANGAIPRTATSCPASALLRTMSFSTDPATGDVRTSTTEPNGDDKVWLQTTTDYDGYGMPALVTQEDRTGQERWTRYFYDGENMHVVRSLNAVGHEVTRAPHPWLGVVTAERDAAGAVSRRRHDRFGRVLDEKLLVDSGGVARGAETTISYAAIGDPFAPGKSGLLVTTTASTGGRSRVFSDRMGRALVETALHFNGMQSFVRRSFDDRGLEVARSRPQLVAADLLVPTTLPSHEVRFDYDGIGRLRFRRRPGDAGAELVSQTAYRRRRTTETDESGKVSAIEYDTLGRPALIEKGTAWTKLFHEPFGQVDRAERGSGSLTSAPLTVTRMVYDIRGRRHELQDPDTGLRRTLHNGFGDAREEIDANGVSVVTSYDAAGRVETVVDASGTRRLVWDTSPRGIGQLGRTESPDDVREEFGYDEFGRALSTVRTVEDARYTTGVGYDTQGRVAAITYPASSDGSAFVLEHVYGGATGELTAVRRADNPTVVYWNLEEKHADGSIARSTVGGRYSQTFGQYAATGRIRDLAVTDSVAGELLQSLAFVFHANGSLAERHDHRRGLREAFVYDTQDRLHQWFKSAPQGSPQVATDGWLVVYGYNDAGNLESRTMVEPSNSESPEIIQYGYGNGLSASRHAVISATGIGAYEYDSNGKQISRPGGTTIEYTSFDLPTKALRSGTEVMLFGYDAQEQRAYRQSLTTGRVTHYAGDGLYERRRDGTQTVDVYYVAGGAGVVAQVNRRAAAQGGTANETVEYLLSDQLGTPHTIVSATGEVKRPFRDPYGNVTAPQSPRLLGGSQPLQSLDATTIGFTGHEDDEELELINATGRIFDPKTARFLTPDPLVADPFDVRAYNRYMYGYGNPLKFVDPSGFENDQTEPDPNAKLSGEVVVVTKVCENDPNSSACRQACAEDPSRSDCGGRRGPSSFDSGAIDLVDADENGQQQPESRAKGNYTSQYLAETYSQMAFAASKYDSPLVGERQLQFSAASTANQQVLKAGVDIALGTYSMAFTAGMRLGRGQYGAAAKVIAGAAALAALPALGGMIKGATRGAPIAGKIEGFTKHGLDQAITRGVKPAPILDAVKSPLQVKDVVTDSLGRQSQRYIGREAEVVLNPQTGQVLSVNPTSSAKAARLLGGE